VGVLRQVGEIHVTESQCLGIRPAGSAMQAPRVRLDGEETRIEGSVMDGAEDETVPEVIGPPGVFRPQMGGIQRLHEVEITHGAAQAIALKDQKFETLLAPAGDHFACSRLPCVNQGKRSRLDRLWQQPWRRCLAEGNQEELRRIIPAFDPAEMDIARRRMWARRGYDNEGETELTSGFGRLNLSAIAARGTLRARIVVEHAVTGEIVSIGGARVQDPDRDPVAVRGQRRRAGLIDPHTLCPTIHVEAAQPLRRHARRSPGGQQRPPQLPAVLQLLGKTISHTSSRTSWHATNTITNGVVVALWITPDRSRSSAPAVILLNI
jgi:hypothetical protein